MAFVLGNLSMLAYANNFTLWHYRTGRDQIEVVGAANYFAGADDLLNAGDMILTRAADGARVLVVTLADIKTVTTAPLS